MRPVTVHMRAGSTGKAAVNELCLNPRHWRSRIDGITLRGDVMVVNCRPCRILYARMWRDLGLTEYDYPKTDSGPLCNASESGYLDSADVYCPFAPDGECDGECPTNRECICTTGEE